MPSASARKIAGLRSPVSGLLVTLLALAAFAAAPAHAAPAVRQQTGITGDPEAAAALMAKGDQAAAAGRAADALDAWRKAYERLFPSFRGLAFKAPVQAEYLDRNALRDRLMEVLARDTPDARILSEQRAMAAFGFVAPDFNLKDAILQLHSEQVAGFYDPKKKRLFLIRDDAPAGAGGATDPFAMKMTLAHEMSHALMDQHYDLDAIDRGTGNDDDMELAVSGLVEGEATLDMMVAMDPKRADYFLHLPPMLLDLAITLMKPLLAFTGGPAFAGVPVILKEPMMFPYLKGLPFCLGLTRKTGNWKLVDAAFAHPPLSTEQVLHPTRYPGDVPIALSFPDVTADLGEGWAAAESNVVGELAARLLLAGTLPILDAEKAAEGWGGDFYRVYARPQSADVKAPPQLALVWASTWDTPEDAREFRDAYTRLLAARTGQEAQDGSEVAGMPQGVWARAWLADDCRSAVIGRGSDVWVLTGVPETTFAAVLNKAMQVTRKPKRLVKRNA